MGTKAVQTYLRQQNIVFSADRILIKGLGGMAQGLFASLLMGTILKTAGGFLPGAAGAFLTGVAGYTAAVQGAAMSLGIGYAMEAPPYVLFSLTTVGYAANALGGDGGSLAVYLICLPAILAGKLVSRRTPVDLLVTPTVTILTGVALSAWLAPAIGGGAAALGRVIMWSTEQRPFLMGVLVSVLMGTILTLPISSAAICASLGLVGLAGGAAVAGCCAHMVGFAVCAYRDNRVGGLVSVGLGTSMLLMPNLIKKPLLWLPVTAAAAVTGPLATCFFRLTQNSAAISSGMGTCGLVGPIGVVSGWFAPGDEALRAGWTAIVPTAGDWAGLFLICFLLPGLIAYLVSQGMRRRGLIQEGDWKLS